MHPDTLEFLAHERLAELDAAAERQSTGEPEPKRPPIDHRASRAPWALVLALGVALERLGAVMERAGRAHGHGHA